MDFDVGEIRRASGQRVGRRAFVVDGEIAGADVGAFRRRARPGLFDDDVAGLELLRERGRGAGGEREREGDEMKKASWSILSDF